MLTFIEKPAEHHPVPLYVRLATEARNALAAQLSQQGVSLLIEPIKEIRQVLWVIEIEAALFWHVLAKD